MKTVLSIDPALKNLAIVKITFDEENTIIDLEANLTDIMKTKNAPFEKIMANLKRELDEITIDDVDAVIIENQPSRLNFRVKSVAVAIYTYFLISKKQVFFVSPSIKLSSFENKLSYRDRKKKSIENTLLILNDNQKEIINTFKKKDDVTDCILMALNWVKKLHLYCCTAEQLNCLDP